MRGLKLSRGLALLIQRAGVNKASTSMGCLHPLHAEVPVYLCSYVGDIAIHTYR